jgi:hypothetical protein
MPIFRLFINGPKLLNFHFIITVIQCSCNICQDNQVMVYYGEPENHVEGNDQLPKIQLTLYVYITSEGKIKCVFD